MTTWFTSDLHLGHEFVAKLRGFASSKEHDERLFSVWERKVREQDEVWVLGDVAMAGWRDRIGALGWLPGTKHLVLGNHDRAHPLNTSGHSYIAEFAKVFETVQTVARVNLGHGLKVALSHFPYSGDHGKDRFSEWRLRDSGIPIVHGHTHSSERLSFSDAGTPQVCVGLDAWPKLATAHDIATVIEGAR